MLGVCVILLPYPITYSLATFASSTLLIVIFITVPIPTNPCLNTLSCGEAMKTFPNMRRASNRALANDVVGIPKEKEEAPLPTSSYLLDCVG